MFISMYVCMYLTISTHSCLSWNWEREEENMTGVWWGEECGRKHVSSLNAYISQKSLRILNVKR